MKVVCQFSIAILVYILFTCNASGQQITFADSAGLFMPGLVSTPNADVKITFSADGKKMLWGGIDWIKDKKDLDIWQSEQVNGRWGKPERVTFDSDSNDFDPFFAPDGKGVYFFSDRPGGFGGDDIYYAAYNSKTNTYGSAKNVGKTINTAGNEWAPVTDASGSTLLFSSNGHGGFGGQDLFTAKITSKGFEQPINLGETVNGSDDDFDAVLLPGNSIIFTSAKGKDPKADLYFAYYAKDKFAAPVKLPAQINAQDFWTFGPSVNFKEPGYIYFSSHLSRGIGRTDIYRIKYTIK